MSPTSPSNLSPEEKVGLASPDTLPSPSASRGSLLTRWMETSRHVQRRVLVYVAAATATVYGLWKLLGQKDEGFTPSNWQFWVALAIAVIPALAALLFEVLPRWLEERRRRRLRDWSVKVVPAGSGYFRLTQYGEQDQNDFTRDDQAHIRAVNWYHRTKSPILYLTGVSGSGKSSILAAFVIPRLQVDTLVVTLRASNDPICHLRQILLSKVWKVDQAKEHESDDLSSLLQSATKHLGKKGSNLLIVFDQFEEYLASAATASSQPDEVLDLLRMVSNGSISSCRALISFRVEFIGDLTRCSLPYVSEYNNFLVEAFEESAARGFLAKGFDNLGQKLLDRVMAEAAELDNLVGRIRPITLNMVGQMLRQFPTKADGLVAGPRPFADYIRRVLEQNDVLDHGPRILRALLDNRNRRVQKTVEQLAEGSDDKHVVNGCLERLALPSRGLVRCLNPGEANVQRRRWEVSHDFVATVITNALPKLQGSDWKRIRPWLAPAACIVWVVTFAIILPSELHKKDERRRDGVVARLSTEFGIRIAKVEDDGSLAIKLDPGHSLSSLDEAVPLLNYLGSVSSLDAAGCITLKKIDRCAELTALRNLNLHNCYTLASIDGVKGLRSLQWLDLSGCGSLRNVDDLKGLTSLKELDLSRCESLRNVDGLKGLTSLQRLDLSECSDLASVDVVKDLTSLKELSLFGCLALASVDVVKGLTSLQRLDLSGCSDLASVDVVKGLTSLQELNLPRCDTLRNVDGLKGLTSLQKLNLSRCDALRNVDGLKGLTSLKELDLSGCDALRNVDGLKGLTSLQKLRLFGCPALASVDVVKGLTSLQELDLSGCPALASVGGLKGLTSLQELDLSGCPALASVGGLKGLTSLRKLYVRRCDHLTSVDGLDELTSLKELNLSGCPALASVGGLKGLTSLKELDLSGCPALASVGGLKGLTSLQKLYVRRCDHLTSVDGLDELTSLKELDLSGCPALASVGGLKGLTSLQRLDLSRCPALASVDGLKGLTSLWGLDLSGCPALASVDGLKGLTSLQRLDLSRCPALASVDGLKGLTSLQRLDLSRCPALASVDGLKGLTSLKELNLSGCKHLRPEQIAELRTYLSTADIASTEQNDAD